jgi:hypothetical protein
MILMGNIMDEIPELYRWENHGSKWGFFQHAMHEYWRVSYGDIVRGYTTNTIFTGWFQYIHVYIYSYIYIRMFHVDLVLFQASKQMPW